MRIYIPLQIMDTVLNLTYFIPKIINQLFLWIFVVHISDSIYLIIIDLEINHKIKMKKNKVKGKKIHESQEKIIMHTEKLKTIIKFGCIW